MNRFHQNQSGSALTEFVVGLPIFIILFHGIINLYDVNNRAMHTMAEAERDVWQQSLQIQTDRFADPTRMSPLTNLGSTIFGGPESRSVSDALDVSSSVSLWADAAMKAEVPTSLIESDVEPHVDLADVMGSDELYSHNLMNDLPSTGFSAGSGWAGKLSGFLDLVGARPAIAAGMRYGVVRGEASSEVQTRYGDFDLDYRVTTSAPTFPTHRIYAVALTRAELAQDPLYDEAIVEFTNEIVLPDGSTQLPPSNEENAEEPQNPLQPVFDDACRQMEGAPECD